MPLWVDDAELAREEGVPAVREDDGVAPVQLVHDLHVELTAPRIRDSVFDALELGLRRRGEQQRRREHRGGVVEPVRTGERCWGRGQEEEFVHGLQQRSIRVKGEDAGVLCLVERQQLRVAVGPRR